MGTITRIATVTLAGLPAAAAAQSVTLTFTADRTEVSIGETVSWVVSASFTGFDDPSAYFGGFNGSFVAAFSGSAQILSTTNLLPFEGLPPTFDGATIHDVNIFQAALLGSDDSANPINIFAFEMQVLTPVGLNSITGFGVDGFATVFPDNGIFTGGEEFVDIIVRTDGIVPAPGVACVLVGGLGVVTSRRRRG